MEHYENLQGGVGREVFFRAPRYGTDELGRSDQISIAMGGHQVRINDISMSGMSVIDPAPERDWTADIGEQSWIDVDIAGERIFSGPVELARTEVFPSSVRIGLSFVDWCPDISRLMACQLESEFSAGLENAAVCGTDLVPQAYKAICADVLHLLTWQRDLLDSLEKRVGWSARERETRVSVAQSLEQKVLERWKVLWQAAEDEVRGLRMESPEFLAVKSYTEQVLTPAFMGGPIWERSYHKPRGYPGDFAIMKMVYAWAREGEEMSDRIVHRIGLEVAECIATRMVLVQQAIAETIRHFGQDGTARIASLGCGPAKEIENILSSARLAGKADFTLIDQDLEALEDTHARLMPSVAGKRGQARLNILQESFVGIIRGGVAAGQIEGQHLIYTVGLVDYLKAGMARGLVSKLYGQLAPGGLLIIGNMADSKLSNYWPMEFIADWRVEYRNRDEMLDMATRCKGAEVEVMRENTGRVWMLYVRKPQ
jgi:extracellular factor (EF) 3-hydroxypalmitic acid methyl ester biosynthesis protein